ncbi:MAG TPA: hypothetical protein PKD35_09545 [Nitrosomonas sp.]|nr:hypothetical protein [Nitrosomonas sp.]
MVTWKGKVPECFAGMTAPFGSHPNDRKRAEKMLHLALREGATFNAVIREAKRWLKQQGVTKELIEEQVEMIKRFRPNPFPKRKLGAAWLITWEGTSPPKRRSKRIVSILGCRVSSGRVLEHVEQLYIDLLYSLHEKITYARHRAKNPYSAEYVKIDGIQPGDRITCGHNPFLLARLVKNLEFHHGADGEEVLAWDEIPIPKSLP